MLEPVPQNLNLHRTQIEIPPNNEFIGPSAHFIEKFAAELGIPEEKRKGLLVATEQGIRILQKNLESSDRFKKIGIGVLQTDGKLQVELVNRGVPLFLREEDPEHAKFNSYARALDRVDIQNRGREGQTIILSLKIPPRKYGSAGGSI